MDHAARRRGALAWRTFVQSHRFCLWELFEAVDCLFPFLAQREKWTRWICVVTNYSERYWTGYLLPRADGRGEIGRPWNQLGTPDEPATIFDADLPVWRLCRCAKVLVNGAELVLQSPATIEELRR